MRSPSLQTHAPRQGDPVDESAIGRSQILQGDLNLIVPELQPQTGMLTTHLFIQKRQVGLRRASDDLDPGNEGIDPPQVGSGVYHQSPLAGKRGMVRRGTPPQGGLEVGPRFRWQRGESGPRGHPGYVAQAFGVKTPSAPLQVAAYNRPVILASGKHERRTPRTGGGRPQLDHQPSTAGIVAQTGHPFGRNPVDPPARPGSGYSPPVAFTIWRV